MAHGSLSLGSKFHQSQLLNITCKKKVIKTRVEGLSQPVSIDVIPPFHYSGRARANGDIVLSNQADI